jgi:hypothetical protein
MSDPTSTRPTSPLAPADSPAAIAHLGMIQAIVTRLAGNSVQCKSWCLAIVSALFGFAGAIKSDRIAAVAIIPIVIFGLVDAAYLAHEKAYRDLYNAFAAKIRAGSYQISDCFALNAAATGNHYWSALRSWSVWPVYLGLIAAYALVRAAGLLNT